jgi:uncharacterized protein (TIGR03083 family)
MPSDAAGIDPIFCAHLLRPLDRKLLEVLGALAPEEWEAQTVAPAWRVRDVAAHLLDTMLRKLSLVRDGCQVEQVVIRSPHDLLAIVNRWNQEGVTVYRRLSPPVLCALIELAAEESARFHEALDPFAPATFAVSWAGDTESPNWFDTARELTERWHHQQQIRLATHRPGILTPEFYYPVLDCFLRGLPYCYREVEAPAGTVVLVEIPGACGGRWVLRRDAKGWRFRRDAEAPAARISIPPELAWRIFTKGIDREEARAHIIVSGDRELGERALRLTAIVG